MSSFIISYDLCKPGRNYESLYTSIKSLGAWARITESTWFVKSSQSSAFIRDKLLHEMDVNDRLFVAKLAGEAAWSHCICSNEFLLSNL